MKQLVAGVLTAVILGLLLWSGVRRSTSMDARHEGLAASDSTVDANPVENVVRRLLDSTRTGDVDAYLDQFAGPLRTRLDREVEERGRAAFADDLRTAATARKSHAMFAPEIDAPDAARVTVEAVYLDRNERQTYRLERIDDAWKVAEVETIRSRQPKERYGAPATYNAPEGVPVQGGGVTVETGDEGFDALPQPRTGEPR